MYAAQLIIQSGCVCRKKEVTLRSLVMSSSDFVGAITCHALRFACTKTCVPSNPVAPNRTTVTGRLYL